MTRSILFCNCRRLLFFFVSLFVFTVFSFGQNPIVTENSLSGNPFSEWSVPDFRDNRISGFATKMSLNAGSTVRFKINVQSAVSYTIKIYRIGYYGGNGARLMQNLGTFSGVVQPTGISDGTTGLLDCSNWSESASWAIPSNAVSGLYVAKLERSGGGSNHVIFIVRNDASNSDLYLQFPDATWQAYNGYGGNSMYDGNTSWPAGHAVKASYNRPFFPYNSLFNTDGRQADWYMNATYPMIRWLERNGYDITYTCSNDVSRNGNRLLNHKVFVTVGHEEYVSKDQRNYIEAARNAGVHLTYFTGNDVYWKTRWENSDGTEDRTLVCYKEGLWADGTLAERVCGYKCDPSPEWTGLWRTGENYDAGKPENNLIGQISWVEYPAEIGVPSAYKKLRFWRNSSIPNMSAGQTAFLGVNTLGYEWDYEQPQYASSYPAGRITMSSRTVNSLTHKLSLYRHSSGALVFGAGTVQWSWGLDGSHYGGTTTISPEMQQATVNLFADMGVQPGSLQSGLTAASQSTDFIAPSASITSPPNGATVSPSASVTFAGTATDAGGGVVAAVEISLDGGNTWSQATFNSAETSVTWSYIWTAGSNGTYNIRVRGVDDSGNIGSAAAITLTVGSGGGDITPPTVTSVSPFNGEAGVSTATTVSAIFSESINSSTVTTSTFQLRDAGNNLITASINTSGSQITLTPSSALIASTTYTVTITGGASGVKDLAGNPLVSNYTWSFTTATGGGGGSTIYTVFQSSSTPATPLANDEQGIELGMRFRSTQNGFINGIRYYKGSGTSGTHIGSLWTNGGTRLAQATFINETPSGWQQVLFSSPVAITAGVTYVASYFSPSGDYAATKPYFTQNITNGPLIGLADGLDGANGLYRYTSTSLFPTSSFQSSNYWVDVVFVTTTSSDNTPPTVSSVSPLSGATGVSTGTNVTATFSEAINSSTVTTSTFQLRDAGNNLVSATVSTTTNQITLTPTSPLSGSTVYTVTITGGSPGVKDLAGNALVNNYSWSFTTVSVDNTPPTVTSVLPLNGATGVSTGTGIIATFSEAINASTVTTSTFQLRNSANTLITASVSASGNQITLTPSAALSGSTVYTATITGGASGVKDLAGNALANNYSWSFTTVSVDNTPPTVTLETPANGATGVSTGTGVTATFSEVIDASTVTTSTFQLRNSANTLITATVSTSGNQITLTPSAALSGSTVYTATITGGSSGVKDLAGNALVNNYSWSFTTVSVDNTPPTIVSVLPANGATGVATGTNVIANFSETINGSTVTTSTFQLRDAGNNLINAIVSTSSGQITLTPTSALTASTTYTATITGGASGVKDLAGNALASNYSWSFTTAAAGGGGGTTYTIFQTTDIPGVPLANDETGIVLGLRFRSTQNGFINGIRYYKGAGTTGTHVGTLWSNTGSLIAQVTFTSETSSGWQQALFSSPVAITAGVTYVASYFSPSGDYAATKPYFTQNITNGPLIGLQDGLDGPNGLYRYSATNIFPTSSFQSSNYWVDVVFSTGSGSGTSPTVTTQPLSQTLCAGVNASFTSAATGSPAPTVQWQVSTNGGSAWTDISGATSSALSFAATVADNGKQYRAVWTNSSSSVNSNPATLTVNAIPSAPVVNVVNNCGSSLLTASSFSGSLLWSNGATTSSITVTTSGTYTVTQTVNGCTSSAGSGTAGPLNANVSAPTVTVVNNCGSSTLTAGSFTGSLLWSTGATTSSITVTTAGTYTVTQTVNGCTSPAASGTAAPLNSNVSAPTVTVVNSCGSSTLTAGSFTGSLLWSTGATTSSITVTTAGVYTVTQTVSGCTSPVGSGTAAPVIVTAPTVSVVNNCDNSTLTAGSFTGSLVWSNGASASSITVTAPGTYTVTQTVSGCVSPSGSGTAAPKAIPTLTSNLAATATSGTVFTYIPASNVTGTTFSWTRAAVTGISNVAGSGTGNISETLTNTTTSPVNVTYVYTLTANGCINTQNVVVTVNPAATVNCTINNTSLTANFNSTSIPAGRYIWFNSSLNPGSIGSGTSTVTMNITNAVVTFTANSVQYTLNIPNGRIRFDASVTSASTQFVNNVWETVVPRSFTSYIFMTGLAYQVPVNFPGSISNVRWSANVSIDRASTSINWRWSAAVYTSFAANAGVNVKPISSTTQNPYPNSDVAGTPENFKSFLVSGARGAGGTNYTGNFVTSSSLTCSTVATRSSNESNNNVSMINRRLPDLSIEKIDDGKLNALAMPNPSSNYFNLIIRGSNESPVTVRIIDVFGQVVERHERIASNTILRVGHSWSSGSYFAEVTQGNQRKVLRIVKAK
jgi:hypothetical protein